MKPKLCKHCGAYEGNGHIVYYGHYFEAATGEGGEAGESAASYCRPQ